MICTLAISASWLIEVPSDWLPRLNLCWRTVGADCAMACGVMDKVAGNPNAMPNASDKVLR